MSTPRVVVDGDEVRHAARWTMHLHDHDFDNWARLVSNLARLLDRTGSLDALIIAAALEGVAQAFMYLFRRSSVPQRLSNDGQVAD